MFAPDYESYLLILVHDRVMGTSLMSPDDVNRVETHLHDRQWMVHQGTLRCPSWFQEELNRLDSKMRAWWDSWNEEWVLDRLQPEGFYVTVMHFKPAGEWQLSRHLIEFLRANDLHRFTPAEYLAKKQEAAENQQQQNEAAATEKVLEAVDNMSSKQIKEFIAVEEAIASGDTITAHGDSLRFLEHAHAETQKALEIAEEQGIVLTDGSEACINPGMDPRLAVLRRKDRS